MIKIYNKQLQAVTFLENAYKIGYEKRFNEVSLAEFKLPLDDPKNAECNPFNFVEITDKDDYIGMFRIVPRLTVKSESNREIRYTLRHVISTLLDDVLFRYHQTTNLTTAQNIQYILDQQETTHWVLGNCAFTRYFHYKYENENGLLGPLFAIPKPFDVEYEWQYDTTVYPFVLNLVEPSAEVSCIIQEAHNQIGIEKEEPNEIVNRIYPLGYGEGVNQLGIEKVNNGVPYLEDAASIAKYGVQKYVWVDKRFEDANSLKANAQALLKKWANPAPAYRIAAADVSSITQADIHKLKCGRIVRVKDSDLGTFDLRIMSEKKPDIIGAPGNVDLEVGSLTEDIATVQADLERKQQINESYSQGSTNQDSITYNDNCDPDDPALIRFYIKDDVVNINSMDLTYELTEFRTYGKATTSTPSETKTSTAGGATVTSTSSGGQATVTSATGGQATITSESGGSSSPTTNSKIFGLLSVQTEIPNTYANISQHTHQVEFTNEFDHSHSVTIPAHSHNVTLPTHSHSVTVPSHSHNVTIGDHSHEITIPGHSHDIVHGIFKLEDIPSAVTIKVDGNTIPITATSGENIDITPYLSKDSEGKIQRNRWVNIEIFPNALARVNATVITRLFIQSRGDNQL